MSKLMEVLQMCQKYGYFNIDTQKNIIKYTNLGSLFTDNIKRNWLDSEQDIKVYPNGNVYDFEMGPAHPRAYENIPQLLFDSAAFHQNFTRIKQNLQRTLPFAISQEIRFRENVFAMIQNNTDAAIKDVRIENMPIHFLSHLYFIDRKTETEMFNRMQRTKKIWWMKFASKPGRIFLSDRVANDTVFIKARYDFGELILEKIQTIPFERVIDRRKYDYSLICSGSGKYECPHIIRTETCLEIGTIALLCDALGSSSSSKTLYVHRKLAPYQCAVLIDLKEVAMKKHDELIDYSKYLMLTLKSELVTVANLVEPSTTWFTFVHDSKKTIESEFVKFDTIGVPYVLILNGETLEKGEVKLRSRDTGLSEVIHVTDIPNQVVKNVVHV